MTSSALRHPAIDAALSAAATLLGTEVVFIGGLTDTTFRVDRMRGDWPGVVEGLTYDRADSFCGRMLAGAPAATADAAAEPAYADLAAQGQFGVRTYVGVPIRRSDGTVLGTLCGVDRGSVPVAEATVGVLRELAGIVAAHLPAGGPVPAVIRRTPDGWTVGDGEPEDGLLAAMVLADLLDEDLSPGARPGRVDGELDETARLRAAVGQLEHALAARVTVEQAIGVLGERFGLRSRDAFERLRRSARAAGRRVHDLSREVVASASAPGTPLPLELVSPRQPRGRLASSSQR